MYTNRDTDSDAKLQTRTQTRIHSYKHGCKVINRDIKLQIWIQSYNYGKDIVTNIDAVTNRDTNMDTKWTEIQIQICIATAT